MSRRARAFQDAVRDIIQADGVFRMASEENPGVVWEWDGVDWLQTFLDHKPRRNRR